MGFAPGGLCFQRRNILSPDLECILHVLNRHGTVLDLVTADDPLKVVPRWITEGSVQSTGQFCTLFCLLVKPSLFPETV
jgi:hypothetical protein